MPNRMLRDWTGSDKVNSLSVHSERFFTRLIMKVDDYGCFFADERLLKAHLFPLLLESIREADLLRWTTECQKAGLIVLYRNTNKKYLQIIDFKQRLDKARSKYPLPDATDFPEIVNEFPDEREVEPEVELEKKPKGDFLEKLKAKKLKIQDTTAPPPEIIYPFASDEFLEMWKQWKLHRLAQDKFSYKTVQSEQAALSELANVSKGFEDAAIGIIRQSMARQWGGFFEIKNDTKYGKKPTGSDVDTGESLAKISRMFSKT